LLDVETKMWQQALPHLQFYLTFQLGRDKI